MELIAAAWRTVRRLTGDYLTQHATIEGHDVKPVPAVWNTEQVETSLRTTGPVAFKNAISNGRSEQDALRSMVSSLTGAAERVVLNGGRDTIAATVAASVEEDGEIVGWRRVSDGDPCPWCAMLIGRGAVYGSQASASRVVGRAGRAKAPGQRAIGTSYHDHCGCTAEPLYDFEEEPAEVEEIYAQWKTVTAGKSFKAALKAWREYWNSDARRDRAAAQDTDAQPAVAAPEPETTPEPAPEPEPTREPEPRPIDVARARQQRIDEARSKADVLAQLEELLINDSDAEVVERHLELLDRRHNLGDDPDLAPLLNVDPGDHSAIRRLLERIAEALGLERIGGDRQLKVRSRFGEFDVERGRFVRREHDIAGGDRAPRDGADVDLVRPGYAVDIDGERVVLSRAVVEEASDDEILSQKAIVREFHSSLDGIADLAEMARLARGRERERLYGGQSADVRLIRLDDGRVIVAKRASDWGDPDMAESVVEQADAEQLAAALAQAIGAPVARVYRNQRDAVWMEFIDGDHDFTAADLDSRDGILLGLLDAVIVNGDRNGGNLMRDRNRRLVGLDHGSAWGSHLREEGLDRPQLNADPERPVKHFVTADREWADNPLTPEDVAELRRRITARRPDFERLGRGEWLAYTLRVLDKLAEFAKGTVRLYE